jgi:hypothetical protein
MTAATTDRNTYKTYIQRQIVIPLTASTDIPHGVIVMVVAATGTALNGADTASGLALGFCAGACSYAAGDRSCVVEKGCGWVANDGTITAANIGQPCEVKDNQTVSLTTTSNHVAAGTIEGVDAALGVLVAMLGGLGPRGATGPAGP